MEIKQFEDIALAQFGYAISSEHKMILIDPARDIAPYLAYAAAAQATIVGVIETHPHADFVSGHLTLHQLTGATIYCSRLVGATYPHQPFDDGDEMVLGNIKLKALNTPGHSPDSISIVLEEDGRNKAVFTGDTLFVGDCGRPDLRENVGNITAKREELAKQMYDSLHNKLLLLEDDVLVYPAHGAGTLCGKSLGKEKYSTIGNEKVNNWSLQEMSVPVFVSALTAGQPFIPAYFPYNVELNKRGAGNVTTVPRGPQGVLEKNIIVIDTRPEAAFKQHHLPGSFNLQHGGKFETWLGSIVAPGESFYLVAENKALLEELIFRCSKIGYDAFIVRAFVFEDGQGSMAPIAEDFATHLPGYTIVDVRNSSEVKEHRFFDQALLIPLPELRQRVSTIPLDKPIVVHCAGGYRSAAASSIIQAFAGDQVKVFDLGESIQQFQ